MGLALVIINNLWVTSVGLISLEHLSFSCSLWHAVSRIWAGFPGIALLVVTELKHFHLFSLLPNVFPRGLVICHRSSCINVTPLAELFASLVSRKVVVLQITLCLALPTEQFCTQLRCKWASKSNKTTAALKLKYIRSSCMLTSIHMCIKNNPTPKPHKQKPVTNNNKESESIRRPKLLFSNNYFFVLSSPLYLPPHLAVK